METTKNNKTKKSGKKLEYLVKSHDKTRGGRQRIEITL